MPTQTKRKDPKMRITPILFGIFIAIILVGGLISLFLSVDHKSNHREKVETVCKVLGYKTYNFNGNSHYVCLDDKGVVIVPEALQ